MVVQNNLHQLVRVVGLHQNFSTNHRMLLNNREFIIRQFAGLTQHVVVNSHFTDIMQMRCVGNQGHRCFRQAKRPCNQFGVFLHAIGVVRRIGILRFFHRNQAMNQVLEALILVILNRLMVTHLVAVHVQVRFHFPVTNGLANTRVTMQATFANRNR